MRLRDDTPRFTPKDEPLRDDVRTLGAMLGGVIREQAGDALFERVEAARLAARARRAGDPNAEAVLLESLAGLSPAESGELVRAFSAYFGLVNLAERVHRIRRRREVMRTPGAGQIGGLTEALRMLAERGVSPEALMALLRSTEIVPVMTAHPTEATRRTLLVKEQRIARALVDRLDLDRLVPHEQQTALARVRQEVAAAWQTDENLAVKPTVADEVDNVLFFVSDVIYRIVPALAEELDEALAATYPGLTAPGPVVRFASWVGGDMDGNPYVGPDTIRATLARHRSAVLGRYERELGDLIDRLSQSLSRVSVDPDVLRRADEQVHADPELLHDFPDRYGGMPYRRLLWIARERLRRTASDAPHGYGAPGELLDDLRSVAASLHAHGGEHAGLHRVRRLLRRIECFGFHLAALDVRQDALVHRRAVGGLLGTDGFERLPQAERTAAIEQALTAATPAKGAGEAERESLDVMRAIDEGLRRYGAGAFGPFIVSMTQGPDDALAVLLLARAAGLVRDGAVPLDVAPLFETVDDLAACRATLSTLLRNPEYRRHLDSRGGRQVVMLGYSDSSKDSGIAASRWALWQAQRELVDECDASGVRLVLFHGRGGTISRGGSKPRSAILAEPAGAVRGTLRLTEQGEIINAKYGLRDIAIRTLEQMLAAVLEASTMPPDAPDPRWLATMATIATASRRAFRALVHEDPTFWPLFRIVTPIDVVERLAIGSRPASRRSQRGVDDLRAIPWVFAWTQNRVILPGWYGLADGLEAALATHGEDTLREMTAGWPLLSNLLADVEMVLAKADMGIGARYLALGGEAGERLRAHLEERFEATAALICTLQGTTELLQREPVLRRAIQLRNPYVDPMSLLQVDQLARWRAAGSPDGDLLQGLFATVRGIARGLQNTG